MIKHVVLFNIKAGTSQKQIDAMVAGYNSMKDVVPELLSWSMGPNLRSDGEFAHAMVAVVENMETLQRYVDHPLHKQVATELGRPIFEKRVIADDLELQRYSLKNMATHFARISSSQEVQLAWPR